MKSFAYAEPTTVVDVSVQLQAGHESGEESKIISGGTAILLAMRQRLLAPARLISLGKIKGFDEVTYEANVGLGIGAGCRHADIAQHPLVQQHYPVLAQLFAELANPQVREQGTIGGNLCYADPATDPPACLLALDASVVLQTARETRVLLLSDFLLDYFTTALQPNEVLFQVRLPVPASDQIVSYRRFKRTAAEHRPLLTMALSAIRGEEGRLRAVRLAVGASVPVPLRLSKAEGVLNGQIPSSQVIRQAISQGIEGLDLISDERASGDFRAAMLKVNLERMLLDALLGQSVTLV